MSVVALLPVQMRKRHGRHNECGAVVVLLDHESRLEAIADRQPENAWRIPMLAVVSAIARCCQRAFIGLAKRLKAIPKIVEVREEICPLFPAYVYGAIRNGLQPIPTKVNRFDYVGVPSHA